MTWRQILTIWLVIILVSLVPVVALYLLFAQMNYFEATGVVKGVIASGPIAAYMVEVLVGAQIFLKLFSLRPILDERLERILGDWEFESLSSHDSRYLGTCGFAYQDGQIRGTGTFTANGRPIGQWSSLAVATDGNQLIIVYEMNEIKAGESKRTRGVNEVNFGADKAAPMDGTWTVLGATNNADTITYKRPATMIL